MDTQRSGPRLVDRECVFNIATTVTIEIGIHCVGPAGNAFLVKTTIQTIGDAALFCLFKDPLLARISGRN